jgi:hypothetical protein
MVLLRVDPGEQVGPVLLDQIPQLIVHHFYIIGVFHLSLQNRLGPRQKALGL